MRRCQGRFFLLLLPSAAEGGMSGDEDGEWVVVRARSWVAIVLDEDEDGMGEGKGREVSFVVRMV